MWRVWSHDGIQSKRRQLGHRKFPRSPRGPGPKPKGKGKGGKGRKGAASLDEWPNGQEAQPSDEKAIKEVVFLFVGAVSRHERSCQRDWQAWERIQKQARDQWKSCKSGTFVSMLSTLSSERERVKIDLTIDSGCAACALPVGVASTVRMQELNRTLQEYIAANAEKFRELGFKNPTLKFQTSDVWNLKFSVMDKLPKPLVAACKVGSWQSYCASAKNQGGSFIEDVRSKQETNL